MYIKNNCRKQVVCGFVKRTVFIVVCIMLGSAPFSFAKQPEQSTITLYGKVVDEAGNPVPGANVNAHIHSKGVGKSRAV